MMDVKISAIIPCYNTKKNVLIQCIDSILKQDYQDFEIIIVNDGSDYSYANDIQEVSKLDSRITVVNQNNRGVSAARNNGLKHATGEYITFIDSDDMIVPYFFSEAYHIAKENNADYVVGCVYHTKAKDSVIHRYQNPKITVKKSKNYKPSLINVKQKFSDGSYYGRGPVARLLKRSILESVFFQEDVQIGEDIIWNIDAASKCDKIYLVQQIWYIYYENQYSITRKYNPHIVLMCETHLQELFQRIDINSTEELAAYCIHISELLSDYVFGCYYGRPECPLSVCKRYTLFSKLCQQEPWSFYQLFFSRNSCGWKIKLKCLLINLRLLYWVYYIKDFIKKKEKILATENDK